MRMLGNQGDQRRHHREQQPCQAKAKISGIMRAWASMMNEVNNTSAANRMIAWL